MNLLETLARLCELPGPSGREDAVRSELVARWSDRAERVETDAIGNVIAHIGGSGHRLLIQAHMDEIGFVVRHISRDGFVFLDTAQGERRYGPLQVHRHMIGSAAQIIGRTGVVAHGVFASSSGHIANPGKGGEPDFGWDDFFVDLGASNRQEVEALGVHVGASVIFAAETRQVGSMVVGKAMDDRVALTVMDALLDSISTTVPDLRYDLWFAATVQEEPGPGRHGARALAARTAFDLALALDVGLVGDIPTVGETQYDNRLGAGPALVHKDGSHFYDAPLLWRLADTADESHIPFQHAVYAGYGSDGMAFFHAGIPTALIAIPTRYTHTSFEMVDLTDVYRTIELLRAFVERPLE